MSRFGSELRQERAARGVALEALAAETRINLRHLEALERGDFHELPGGVFRRGMAKAHFAALGLDQDVWLPRLDEALAEHARLHGTEAAVPAEEAWVEFAENVQRSRPHRETSTRWRWVGVGGLASFVGVAAWALWTFELRHLLP